METKEIYSLIGIDRNAFAIMGYVQRAMRHEKFTKEEIDAYIKKATSSCAAAVHGTLTSGRQPAGQ